MDYRSLSDEELLAACSHDDRRAFNVIFDRYAPKLHRLGQRYIKDQFVLEELALDLLFNLWERRRAINIQTGLSAYLFRAMHYKAISHLRKAAPIIIDIDNLPEDTFEANGSADNNLLFVEAEEDYQNKLQTLSPQRRKVFELSREQDLSYADIAKELGLSPNTVENHMVAALSALRKLYKDYPVVSLTLVSGLLFL